MSWYTRPISPFDPVIVSQQPKPPSRYFRDNFTGTGQNSHVQPPSQDPAQWQALTNTMPVTQGVLNPRWGYNVFTTVSNSPNRLYNFQSDALGTRSILAAGLGGIAAYNEDGTTYRASVFTPAAPSGIVRSITSRNYQYFCDGYNTLNPSTHLNGDALKWDGSVAGAVTNIGIDVNDTTANTLSGPAGNNIVGPNNATAISQASTVGYPSWSNLNGFLSSGSGFATVTFTTSSFSEYFYATDFGFAIGSGFTIAGITVTCTAYTSSPSSRPTVNFSLTKNGTGFAGGGRSTPTLTSTPTTYTMGSATDLWGTSWAPSDINSLTFGVVGIGTMGNPAGQVTSVENVLITVYLVAGAGGSTTSGNGVGLVSVLNNGSVALVLGRTYYLVANNSTTGHFSDLSSPSASTSSQTNAEMLLLLATFNDPQVDTKYLLATADGGDPSILYEVKPLVPGLTITSWAIATNVVTFTGTWTGTQFANGSTFYVGGLAHGTYMNNQQMTVTSTTGTTLVASFTHGNDSATESGVCGNYTFAIPNSVGLVVDNTTDPDLVLNQPLLYTDQFANEYGVTLNTPPPAGNLLIKHQGRLWMAGVTGSTHSVYFSKSVTELTLPDGFIAGKYEEAWPGSNYFDVSDGAESVSGLLSDGTTLYIGTQNHIRRLLGNNPSNFQEPQIVHPEVGLLNQEVWQFVFAQGSPAGAVWMTPDFRVIQSDFNTYQDIGTPVQNILNGLQSTASTLAHAAFVADGEFELYILAVPYSQSTYCDTHLVYDLRAQQWSVWQPHDGSLALLFNITTAGVPQWLFLKGTDIFQYLASQTTDNGTTINLTATTSWMHMSEPTRRKVLNEIQVYGNTAMTINVYGANNQGDFASPVTIATGLTLQQNPFLAWVAYLIDSSNHHKYYQFTFSATAGSSPFLGSYGVYSQPLEDL